MTAMPGAVQRLIGDIEAAGLRGTDIANLTSVSKATVSRWCSGSAKPQPENERLIADLHYVVQKLQDYYGPGLSTSWSDRDAWTPSVS